MKQDKPNIINCLYAAYVEHGLHRQTYIVNLVNYRRKQTETRMWANAKRDARPALLNAAKFAWCTLLECMQQRCQYRRKPDLDAKWILHLAKFCGGQEAPEMNIWCTSPGDGQTSCKVRLTSAEQCRCTNEAKTRNWLKFARVPQTRQPISAISGLQFAISWGMWRRYCFLTIFFGLLIHALVAKT